MAIASGTQFGIYRVGAPLGVGGMGEVYRATDTKLERQVAIKVLPESFAQDAERVARFEREAKTLASLNHPNIGQIYGLETQDGTTALVMELVEGPTLAERLAQGPLAPDEALGIARQLIDGLEAAHDRGIVHRDLKPANIKVKADGLVKILDFGIAKSIDASGSNSGRHTPTLITPAVTETGVIMGTAAYMSPEQARGRFVDQRTDVWAFGCVLFEMLTGQPAFGGEDVTQVLARVLERDTDMSGLPRALSPAVRNALRLCLQKDPKKRLHHIGDVRLALIGGLDPAVPQAATARHSSPLWGWLAAIPLAAVVGFLGWQLKPEPARPVVRFVHEIPDDRSLVRSSPGILDIAPNGRRLVYYSTQGLVVRDLDAVEDRVIPGTLGSLNVEFSPDGESLAFVNSAAGSRLVRMDVASGAEIVLANVAGRNSGNISWEADGTLLTAFGGDGIFRVSENGGELELLVAIEPASSVASPQLLPGGEWVLFAMSDENSASIFAHSLVSGERKRLIPGASRPRFTPSGHLVYYTNAALSAVAFDPRSAELLGTPVPVLQNVGTDQGMNVSPYALADDGTLLYLPGLAGTGSEVVLGVADGQGSETALAVPAGPYSSPRVSADGAWLAFQMQYSDGNDIAVWEIGSTTAPRRLTFGGNNTRPAWSADGTRVAYSSTRANSPGIFWTLSDGSGAEERLTQSAAGEQHVPDHFSPDGKYLAYTVTANASSAIWLQDLERGVGELLVAAPSAGASHAVFAPDGRWLAYQAYDTGDNEIYVQPFPVTSAKYQLPSRGDNHHPVWSPDGRQIYYLAGPGRFEGVDVITSSRGVGFGLPAMLVLSPLEGASPNSERRYDVMPDGSLLGTMPMGAGAVAGRDRLIVVQNWFEELERLVPTQ